MNASRLRNNVRTFVHTWLLTYNTFEGKLKGERASMKSNFSVRNTDTFSEEKFQVETVTKFFIFILIVCCWHSTETLAQHPQKCV